MDNNKKRSEIVGLLNSPAGDLLFNEISAQIDGWMSELGVRGPEQKFSTEFCGGAVRFGQELLRKFQFNRNKTYGKYLDERAIELGEETAKASYASRRRGRKPQFDTAAT